MNRRDAGGGQAGKTRGVVARRIFTVHLAVYVMVNLLLFFTDLADGGNWWFFWPLFGWGIGLAAHAAATFGAPWEDRSARQTVVPAATAPPAGRATAAAARPAGTAASDRAELASLVEDAETRVARLWRVARQIESPAVREQAFRVSAAADRVAEALAAGTADPATARAFVERYLAPAEGVLERYVRLVARGVAAAEPTLAKVETHDLPLLEAKLEDLYQQVHRGDVIDLQVARELMELDLDAPPPRPVPRRVP